MKINLYSVFTFTAILASTLSGGLLNAQDAFNNTVLWLRADAGVNTSGATVNSWTSQKNANGAVTPAISGGGGTSLTYQNPATYSSGSFFNYNPSLNFNGKYLQFSNADAATLVGSMSQGNLFYAFRINSDSYTGNLNQSPEIHNFSSAANVNGSATNYYVPFPYNQDYYDDFGASGTNSVYNRKAMKLNAYADMEVPVIYNASNQFSSGTTYRASTFLNSASITGTGTPTGVTSSVAPRYRDDTYPLTIFSGSLPTTTALRCADSEIILIDVAISEAERRNVASYLAIKNGVTLDQTIQYDYTSSSSTSIPWASTGTLVTNTVIWDASTNAAYRYNIIGIGHDALTTQLVNQKQSRSVNTANKGNLISISTQPLASTNAANTTPVSAITGVNSFFMVADNGEAAHSGGPSGSGTTGPNPAANTELPAGVTSRIYREWLVKPTNFVQNVVIGFDISMIGNSTPISNLRLLTDGDGDFSNAVVESFTPTMNSVYTNMVEFVVPVTSYSLRPYFTLASISPVTTLPVELLSFTADCNDGTAELNWKLATETNNEYFTVEGSTDGKIFDELTEIKSYGNTSSGSEYNFEVADSRYEYFRLSQTDRDGTEKNLGMIRSDCGSNDFSVEFYPNPVAGDNDLNLYINATRNDEITVSFYDMTGKLCARESIGVKQGITLSVIPVQKLSKGMYIVKCASLYNEIPAMRMVKE